MSFKLFPGLSEQEFIRLAGARRHIIEPCNR